MIEIGEAIRGDKIGRRANDYYVWVGCPVCHKERWILKWKLTLSNFTGLCWTCSARKNTNRSEATGVSHPRWNGGQTTSKGYVYIFNETHPARTSKGYVKRARLVLEEKLGRYLLPDCVPHHLNHIKDDDRPSNLIELTKSQHTILHAFERRLIARAKSLGIKEVVECLEKEIWAHYTDPSGEYHWIRMKAPQAIRLEWWQAQLKVWFKDNPELLKEWGIERKGLADLSTEEWDRTHPPDSGDDPKDF